MADDCRTVMPSVAPPLDVDNVAPSIAPVASTKVGVKPLIALPAASLTVYTTFFANDVPEDVDETPLPITVAELTVSTVIDATSPAKVIVFVPTTAPA